MKIRLFIPQINGNRSFLETKQSPEKPPQLSTTFPSIIPIDDVGSSDDSMNTSDFDAQQVVQQPRRKETKNKNIQKEINNLQKCYLQKREVKCQ